MSLLQRHKKRPRKLTFGNSGQDSRAPSEGNTEKTGGNGGIFAGSSVVIPNSIHVKFSNDYDINNIHKIIMTKLHREIDSIPRIEGDIGILEQRLEQDDVDFVEMRKTEKKIRDLKEELASLQQRKRLNQYQKECEHLTAEYISVNLTIQNLKKQNPQADPALLIESRIKTIVRYLQSARNFITIDYVRESDLGNDRNLCQGCGNEIDNIVPDCEGSQVCTICGVISCVTSLSRTSEGVSDTGGSKEYSDLNNFHKSFKRYICTQKVKFKIADICSQVDSYLQSKGIRPAKYFYDQEFNVRGKKDGTSLDMIYEALKKIGQSQLYEDSNLIAHHLWGWKKPNVGHLGDIIMKDYMETDEVYKSLPIEVRERKSCISTQYRLFRHLQLRACDVIKSDFKLPSKKESLRKQDGIWKMMCDGCANPEIYYIPM